MRALGLRASAWCAITALVVLAARALAYALAPQSPLSVRLEHATGGPRLIVVAAGALGIAVVLAIAVVGLAALAVRERRALSREPILSAPRLRPLRFALRLAVVFAVSSGAFALLESYLHWRAGLGWHGLQCLTGPVHRDAIPLLAALAIVAVALVEAASHLLAWARRTIARLPPELRPRPRRRLPRPRFAVPEPQRLWLGAPLPARGPPL